MNRKSQKYKDACASDLGKTFIMKHFPLSQIKHKLSFLFCAKKKNKRPIISRAIFT